MSEGLELIRESLRSVAAKEPHPLGAKLGSAIPRDLRGGFQSLRSFIEEHCTDFLVYDRPYGGDIQYKSLISQGPSSGDLWRAFTSTSSPESLFFDSGAGRLVASKEPEPNFIAVGKLSADEHRRIAESFAKSLEPQEAEPLSSALQRDKYWVPWVKALQMPERKDLNRRWTDFRLERMRAELAEKLQAVGVSEEKAREIAEAFGHAPKAHSLGPRLSQSTDKIEKKGTDASRHHSEATETRRVLIDVIANMSEADLLRIWVPLSSVVPLFRRK